MKGENDASIGNLEANDVEFNKNASNVNSDEEESKSVLENNSTILPDTIKMSVKLLSDESLEELSNEEYSDEESEESFAEFPNRNEYFNNGELLRKSLACVKCVSQTHGSDCMYGDGIKYLGNCFNDIGQCYTLILDGNVTRGCVGDELIPDQISAQKYSNSIKLCNSGTFCNQEKLLDTCIVCSGIDCESPSLEMEKVCSYGPTSQGCYLKINSTNNLHERGCMEILSKEDQQKCHMPGSQYCQSCPKRNCNQKVNFNQVCNFCDGTRHKNCFLEVSDAATTTCIGYSSICLTGIDKNGFTHRLCSQGEEEDAERFANGFETCYTDRCNSNVFPENRLECYQCEKDRLCDHPSVELKGKMCRTYPDKCFVYGKEGNFFGWM